MSNVASRLLAVEQSQRLIVLGPALLHTAEKLLAWAERQPVTLFLAGESTGQPGPELLEVLSETAELVEAIVEGQATETPS